MELLGDYGRGVNAAFAQVDNYTADMAKTAGTFTVNKDNVLAAAQIIKTQAAELQKKLDRSREPLIVVPPGEDAVSTRIAPAWNKLLVENEDSYAERIQQYVDGLFKLAQQCEDSAKQYGYSDETIAAAFGASSE
jgi:hypothetical protein